ncbi:unnamed protein product, partial [Ascophyllum nodosum]
AKRYEHGFSSTTPFETRVTLLYLANIWTFKSFCKARVEMKMRQPNETFIEIPREPFCPFLMQVAINTFAVPLGLSSQAHLWGSLSRSLLMTSALGVHAGLLDTVQWFFWALSLVLLIVVTLLYMAKVALYRDAVKREWAHPVQSSYGTIPILTALTLIAGEPRTIREALHPGTEVTFPVFIFCICVLLYLEMTLYGRWLFDQATSLEKANPAYQIAVVGNFLLASLGTKVSGSNGVETACAEISLMFFAVGILYQLTVFMAIQQSSARNIALPPPRAVGVNPNAPGVLEAEAGPEGGMKGSRSPSSTGSIMHMTGTLSEGHVEVKGSAEDIEAGTAAETTAVRLNGPQDRMALETNAGEGIGTRPREVGVMEMVEFTSGGSGIEGRIGADYTSPPAFSVSNYRSISVSTAGITEETPSEDGGQGDEECGRTDRKVRGERNVLPTTTTSSFDLSRQSSTLPEAGLSADPSLGGALIDVKLNPIYFLFVAPPAAASIAWSRLSGDFDVIAKSFFFTSGFLYVLIAIFNLNFLRKAP